MLKFVFQSCFLVSGVVASNEAPTGCTVAPAMTLVCGREWRETPRMVGGCHQYLTQGTRRHSFHGPQLSVRAHVSAWHDSAVFVHRTHLCLSYVILTYLQGQNGCSHCRGEHTEG